MGDVNRSISSFGVPRNDQESIDSFVRPYFQDSGACLCGIHRNASTSSAATMLPASHQGTNINKVYRCMSIFFMVMLCLVMAACGFLLYKFQEMKSQTKDLCYPCDYLTIGESDDDLLNSGLIDKRGNICCANSPEQTKKMFDLIFRRKNSEKRAEELQEIEKTINIRENITNDKPTAAHLNINNKGNFLDQSSTLTWKEESRYGHMYGVTLEDDKYLVINSSGYYYVYSQLLFSKHIDGSVGSFVLHHKIVKKNPTLPRNGIREITHNEQKIANLSNDLIQHTSYTGLIVKLTIGDKIYVSASNSSLIKDSDTVSSFFGLYKVR